MRQHRLLGPVHRPNAAQVRLLALNDLSYLTRALHARGAAPSSSRRVRHCDLPRHKNCFAFHIPRANLVRRQARLHRTLSSVEIASAELVLENASS